MSNSPSQFEKDFGKVALVSKRLEARWFFFGKDNTAYKKPVADVPFQRRNLRYISVVRPPHQLQQRKQQRRNNSPPWPPSEGPYSTERTPDLFARCFKHLAPTPLRYNEAVDMKRRTTFVDTDRDRKLPATATRTPNPSALNKDEATAAALVSEASASAGGATTTESTTTAEKNNNNSNSLRRSMSPLSVSDNSVTAGASPLARLMMERTSVYFHFLYLEKNNNNPCLWTDVNDLPLPGHRRCAFCYFNGTTDVGLLMHCQTCHGETLEFEAARTEDGTLHITVKKKRAESPESDDSQVMRTESSVANEKKISDEMKQPLASKPCKNQDFVFSCRGKDPKYTLPSIPFLKRRATQVGILDLQTRRKRLRQLQDFGAASEVLQPYLPSSTVPIRNYYHCRTYAPMVADDEWEVDSDDEPMDEQWLTRMSEELMDEFNDVSPDEKRFVNLWNRFIKQHTVIADKWIPERCMMFVEQHALSDLKDMRSDLLLHLMNFWDHSVLSAHHVKTCMSRYDEIIFSGTTSGKQSGAIPMEAETTLKSPPVAAAVALSK